MQQPDESNPYEEVYKDSSTFLKVGKVFVLVLCYCHVSFILFTAQKIIHQKYWKSLFLT